MLTFSELTNVTVCQKYKVCCVVAAHYCQDFGLFLKTMFNIDVNQIHQGLEFVDKVPYKLCFKVCFEFSDQHSKYARYIESG